VYCADRWIHTEARQGDYVWLPFEFDGDTPTVNYYQDWDINLANGAWRKFDPARNLALEKTVTASSSAAPNAAANVTLATTYQNYTDHRWESDASDPQWIMVDLGATKDINRVILKWHASAAKEFKIQTSTDASAWTDVFTTTAGSPLSVTDETFKTTSARYVRMAGTQRATQDGYSLYSFMVLKD
jgi:mannan endo-1,4-beta-mannosidase